VHLGRSGDPPKGIRLQSGTGRGGESSLETKRASLKERGGKKKETLKSMPFFSKVAVMGEKRLTPGSYPRGRGGRKKELGNRQRGLSSSALEKEKRNGTCAYYTGSTTWQIEAKKGKTQKGEGGDRIISLFGGRKRKAPSPPLPRGRRKRIEERRWGAHFLLFFLRRGPERGKKMKGWEDHHSVFTFLLRLRREKKKFSKISLPKEKKSLLGTKNQKNPWWRGKRGSHDGRHLLFLYLYRGKT